MQTATFAGYDFATLTKAFEGDCGLMVADGVASTCHWVALAQPDAIRVHSDAAQQNRDYFLRLLALCREYADNNRAIFDYGLQVTAEAPDRISLSDPLTGNAFHISPAKWSALVSDGNVVLPVYAGGLWAVVVKGRSVAAVFHASTGTIGVPGNLPKLEDPRER